MNKYVSDVKIIQHNQEVVFSYLGNINNLGVFLNEFTLSQISRQMPHVSITDFRTDEEQCTFTISGFGEAGFRIIEREPEKMIKIMGTGKIPFEVYLWIQLMSVSPDQCKMRLTLHANLNLMMKMIVGKKMDEAVNKLAQALAMLPYR